MADQFLCKYPELRPFVLYNVKRTGKLIGTGAYGIVEEVAMPDGAIYAAKKIHDFFQDPGQVPVAAIYAQGFGAKIHEGMSADEHPPPPEHRPVSGRRLLSRLATASPRHGATADEPSRLAGSGSAPSV